MIQTYFPVLVLIILAAGFVATMLIASVIFGPRKYSEMKDDPFECGTIGTGSETDRMSVKFYLVAMTFILFDVEMVFLIPWAIGLQTLGWTGFWVMMPFFGLLVLGLVYEWRRGVLDYA